MNELRCGVGVSGRNDARWMSSWWVELIFLLGGVFFAVQAISGSHPWAVLAWPGVLLAAPVWYLITRLLHVRRGPWLVTTFPLLVFALCASGVLLARSMGHDGYARWTLMSLVWPLLLGLDSVVRWRSTRGGVTRGGE
jgi:hypothetical protein